MLHQILDLLNGNAFVPKPIDRNASLSDRFQRSPLLIVSLGNNQARCRIATFSGGSVRFSNVKDLKGDIEDGIAMEAMAGKTKFVAVSMAANWAGDTSVSIPHLDQEELRQVMREEPVKILQGSTHDFSRHIAVLNPAAADNGIFLHTKNPNLKTIVEKLDTRGLTVVHLCCEVQAMLSYALSQGAIKDLDALVIAAPQNLFCFRITNGTWGHAHADDQAEDKAFGLIQDWYVDAFKDAGRAERTVGFLTSSPGKLAPVQRELIALGDLTTRVLLEDRPDACWEAILFAGEDVTLEVGEVPAPLSRRYRALPALVIAGITVASLLSGGLIYMKWQEAQKAELLAQETATVDAGIFDAQIQIKRLDAQKTTAEDLREWCRINPSGQDLIAEVTGTVAPDASFGALEVALREDLRNVRVVATIFGEGESLRSQTRALYSAMARLNYQLVTVESEQPVPYGAKVSAIFQKPDIR